MTADTKLERPQVDMTDLLLTVLGNSDPIPAKLVASALRTLLDQRDSARRDLAAMTAERDALQDKLREAVVLLARLCDSVEMGYGDDCIETERPRAFLAKQEPKP